MCMKSMQKWYNADTGLLMLRVATGLVFLYHGWVKLQGIEGTGMFFGSLGIPLPALMAWVVALVEFVGGIALLTGVYSRIAAKLLAVTMIVALLTAHIDGPWKSAELPLVLLGSMLAIAMGGPGAYVAMKKDCTCLGWCRKA